MATTLYGPDGRPIEPRKLQKELLSEEVAAPTTSGVRSPISGYPGDGLEPSRLAAIMRAADQGQPLEYFELAETIEERDAHYVGVLGTRKRIVSQTEITVEAASDKPEDVAKADMVRTWLKRDTLQGELFNILDAIGKGISFTEIIWDTSEGQWQPAELKYRSPRFFTFASSDLDTPMLREMGGDMALPLFKFITARMPMKSGLTVRSGIARVAAWMWMFKAFTQKDWAIFAQVYGQPIRVGKYASGASPSDIAKLRSAVANIASDCAAVIPATMMLEFIESKTADKSAQLYRERCDWLDQQVSKAVLGQTATTDAIAGGHAVGKEHRQVQEDIKNADCASLAAILNRDLIKPWCDLEYGPQKNYPRLVIRDADDTDVAALSAALEKLVPLGLKVSQGWVRDELGIPDPQGDEELLGSAAPPPGDGATPGPFPAVQPKPKPQMQSATSSQPPQRPPAIEDEIMAIMGSALDAGTEFIIDRIRALAAEATSLPDLREKLMAVIPGLDEKALADAMQQALALSALAGRADAIA